MITPGGDNDATFEAELKQIGDSSHWFTFILFLMCIPGFCYVTTSAAFAKTSALDFQTRCRIPELEPKNWSFAQVQNISAPKTDYYSNCTYFKRNYTKISEMDYDEALEYVDGLPSPKILHCNWFVHRGGSSYSIHQAFSLVCNRIVLEEFLSIAPVYGQFIAGVCLVPFTDLIGRKRMIGWGYNLFITGALFVSLAGCVETVIFGRIVFGMAYTGMVVPIQAIVVEISNAELRPCRFIATNVGIALGYTAIPLYADKIRNWRHLQWIANASLLLLPLVAWYIPESPRWLLSKDQRPKARALLRTIKNPVAHSHLLSSYRNEKTDQKQTIIDHVKEFRPFVASRLWFLTVLLFLAGAVYLKNYSGRFEMKFHTPRSTYLILSGIMEMVCYVFAAAFVQFGGRKMTMAPSFSFAGVLYIVASLLDTASIESLIISLAAEMVTGTVYVTILLYVAESVPTSHRCMATGTAGTFGSALATIVMFHVHCRFLDTYTLQIMLSLFCFLGAVLSVFARESKQDVLCDTVEEIRRPHVN